MLNFPPRPIVLGLVAMALLVLFQRRWQSERTPPLPLQSVPARISEARVPHTPTLATERREHSPTTTPAALFTYVQPTTADELSRALPAPTREIHYVQLRGGLSAGKQSQFWQKPGAGRLEVPLPNGTVLTIVLEGSEMLGADRFISEGRIEGRPLSSAVFAYNQGFLHAYIADPELGSFVLRTATEEFSQFYQIDPLLVGQCGGERRPDVEAVVRAQAMQRAKSAAKSRPADSAGFAIAGAENPQRAEVHVMMVYTEAVLPTMIGAPRVAALQSAFDAGIARVNNAFAASAISGRVRLVKIVQSRYAADGPADGSHANLQDEALDALYKQDDGSMDEIHALRDQVGADIVCLALNRSDAQSSGLSFLLDQPGEATNPQFSFSVVQYSNVGGNNVLPHEIGHLLGCAHDRLNAQSGPGAYDYSYGYTFVASDNQRYHDIMSYPPGRELNYFSNPRISAPAPAPANTPGGVAAGRIGESDTALTIEKNIFEVSTFRLQTQAAANAGTLINVATLAYSGTGNEVLIGGFVIDGVQPKKVLVRGVGPALAEFGVANTLVDPVLRIFSGQSQVGVNNNWGEQSTEQFPTIREAGAAVGAFPFAAQSADAALVMSLAPGPYTAWLEGANGATGFGLVEAYDLDRGANRIVNLSTRGYADNKGREMVGGFVVQGTAGATKRILIRVLGPTLARSHNLAGAMFDPHMEIYNAGREMILQSDDWSTGARFEAGERDDFQPIVRTYGEQQIDSTGFAPLNRREPCVLVDLPPGSYTVIVKPFEFRSPDPTLEQIAEPGLAIVEVYEIAR